MMIVSGRSRVSWSRPLVAMGMIGALFAAPLAALGASSRTVDVTADSYSPRTFSIEVGTTVEFRNTSTFPHTATADDGSFDTGMILVGATKSVTLSQVGTIAFYCQFHGAVGGVGQSGTITVTAAAATPAPTAGTGGSVAASTVQPNAAPPSSATLPELPEGLPGLPVLAFGIAGIGSVLLAFAADIVRRAAKRRPGR